MYVKVSNGGRAACSMIFLVLSAIVSFAAGVIFAYMSDYGCSKAFLAAAIFSFIYFVINIILIAIPKSFDRIPSTIIFIILIGVLIISLIALAYSIRQSVCDICPCSVKYNRHVDDFWNDFNDDDNVFNKKDYERVVCDTHVSDSYIAQYFATAINGYHDYFYIKRGWPIAFAALQSFFSLIHIFLTFSLLYSCNGCRLSKSNKGIAYF